MVRGLALTVVTLTGIVCMTSTAWGAESPAKPNDSTAEKSRSLLSAGTDTTSSCPALTRIRFYPRKGFAQRMLKGRFSGSNAGKTTDFETLAEIKEVPPEGESTEIQDRPSLCHFVASSTSRPPDGIWGNVAEIEFYSGNKKLQGELFGTAGSKGNLGNDFSKALDGNPETFFDGVEPNNQYVGIDLGPEAQAAPPEFSPKPGARMAPRRKSPSPRSRPAPRGPDYPQLGHATR